jgi:hypothetical protein
MTPRRRQILPPLPLAAGIVDTRWQIMGTIPDCCHLKLNLKEKVYIYVNVTTQRCPNKIIKTFLIEDFFHLPQLSTTTVVHLELQISFRIFKKI